ncbi:MAG: tilS, partial [Acidimicrobiales bacterium]|nr:tilS [Acidimicrobiales bacterium]
MSALLARCPQLRSGDAVDCAVSGGPDSMALLALATEAGCRVTAIHVDHGLRVGSDCEAAIVETAARRFGADFRSETVDVTPGANLEARARAARYAVLGPDALTGHTADDQAETMMLNLLRGGALNGLGGMRPHRHPLLALRRRETHELCDALHIDVVDDPSNRLPVHLRNRVRGELLPLMEALARRDLVPILARQADVWRDDADLLDALAAEIDPTDAIALAAAPVALARRAVRTWLTLEHPPDLATVERVLAVARG